MPLQNAGSQIVFTMVGSNRYAANIFRASWSRIFLKTLHFATQPVSDCVHVPLQFVVLVFLDNGSWHNGKQATSLALKRRQQTVDADSSTPIAVLQHWLNPVDKTVQSITAMGTMWLTCHAVVTLCGTAFTHLCVRSASILWFHIILATCPVLARISWYDKPPLWRPTILPHLNSLTYWYWTFPRRQGIPALAFTFPFCSQVRQSTILTLLVKQEMALFGLCVCHLSGNIISYWWHIDLHPSRDWICLGHTFWVLHFSQTVLYLYSI